MDPNDRQRQLEIKPAELRDGIAFFDSVRTEDMLGFSIEKECNHILHRSTPYLDTENLVALRMQSDPDSFRSFPVSTILLPDRAGEETEKNFLRASIDFTYSGEKAAILYELQRQLDEMQVNPQLTKDISVAADEMFTNAILNAASGNGDELLVGAYRSIGGIEMAKGHRGTLFWGTDGERLVLGCLDTVGGLDIRMQLQRIRQCYEFGIENLIQMDPQAGAGIGSYLVFNSATSYYASVHKGRFTLLCCAFPLKLRNRIRLQLPKNLHWHEATD